MTKKIQELETIQRLREIGALTEAEFEEQKRKILGYSISEDDGYAHTGFLSRTESKIKVIAIAVAILVLAAIGWFFLGASDISEVQSYRLTGTANVRSAPTIEGSEVLSVLQSGENVEGDWVEGSSDATTRWLRLKGHDPIAYVWEGNLEALSSAQKPSPSTSTGSRAPLSQRIVGQWICDSKHLGASEVAYVNYHSDGTFAGRSEMSGSIQGITVSGDSEFHGVWSISNERLFAEFTDLKISNLKFGGLRADTQTVADWEREMMNRTTGADIEFWDGHLTLRYDIDGRPVNVGCSA